MINFDYNKKQNKMVNFIFCVFYYNQKSLFFYFLA